MKLNKLMLSAIVVCSFATPVSAMELETTVAPQQTDVKSSSFSKNDATAKLFEIAITGKNVEQIPELIKAGADVNARIKDGADVINVQYVDYIILTCAMKGPSSFVDFLLKKASSSDVNALDDYKKNTPLHCAAMYGHLSVVKVLVKAGADVNARDDYKKNTPLNWAAMHGHLSVVEVLVKAGADVNAQNYEGKTPLHCAAMNGHLSLVKVLVKAGAYVNALDNGGETPLHYAAAHDTADTAFVIKALVKSGANINAQDKIKRATPLHLASRHGHLSNAKTLIAAGGIDCGLN